MSKNTIKTFVLLAFMGGLIMLIGSFFGQQGLIIGAILAFAMVGGSYCSQTPSPSRPPAPSRSASPRCRSTTGSSAS
jgi:hypothetical protein